MVRENCNGYAMTADKWHWRPCQNWAKYDGKCYVHKNQQITYQMYAASWGPRAGKVVVGQKTPQYGAIHVHQTPGNWFMVQKGTIECRG